MHSTDTAADTMFVIRDTARACAYGWAEQSRSHDARRWTNPIPQGDLDFVEMERLGRPMTEDESAEFSRTFIDEYNTAMSDLAAEFFQPEEYEPTDAESSREGLVRGSYPND